MIIRTVFSGYTILSVLFVREIIHIIEMKNLDILPQYILWYGVFNVLFFGITIPMRHWGYAEVTPHLFKMIHRDYMKWFDALDNTYTENIGTGRVISIVGR